MRLQRIMAQLAVMIGALVVGLMMSTLQAQMLSIPGLGGDDQKAEISREEFQHSLNDVITLLESDEQRQQLLSSLKELQTANAATNEDVINRQGLLELSLSFL